MAAEGGGGDDDGVKKQMMGGAKEQAREDEGEKPGPRWRIDDHEAMFGFRRGRISELVGTW